MSEPIDTGKKCTACRKGRVLGHISQEKLASAGDLIIGHGSRNQFTTRVDFSCERCGVMYRHPPEDPDARDRILREVAEKDGSREKFFEQIPPLPKLP